MASSTLSRRTYGPLHGRAPPPSLEKPLTPTEELFSWLPDEVCAACGIPVKASQLYCSDACREQEGADLLCRRPQGQQTLAEPTSSSLASRSAPPTAKPIPATRHYFSNTTAADIDSLQRFRYPCPPSPLLIAQRKTMAGLTTTKSSPPTSSSTFGRGLGGFRPRKSGSTSSISDLIVDRPNLGRRISADSSVSSAASSSASLTDTSTPSPATADRGYGSGSGNLSSGSLDDDEDELNSCDFRLPPSISALPQAAVVLNTRQRLAFHHRSRSDRQISPSRRISNRPRTSVGEERSNADVSSSTTMSFARRPSSTNVPAPVLYSPVLSAKASGLIAQTSINRPSPQARPGGQRFCIHNPGVGLGSNGASRAIAAPQSGTNRPGVISGHGGRSIPDTSMEMHGVRSDLPQMQFLGYSTRKTPSPQHHDSGGSGSSSAARTLRALSPSSLTSSSNDMCGRPGCFGTSFSQDSAYVARGRSTEAQKSICGGAVSSGNDSIGQRSDSLTRAEMALSPRPMTRHKHTHSAKASLCIHDHLGAGDPLKRLQMTPAYPRPQESQELIIKDENISPQEVFACNSVLGDQPQVKGRGRSKARGRRSVSRRSRSPPRAAARGRSVALQKEEQQRKATNSNSPSIEAVRPRSDPIDIDGSLKSWSRDDAVICGSPLDIPSNGSGRTISSQEEDEEPRRGRSPAEHSRRWLNPHATGVDETRGGGGPGVRGRVEEQQVGEGRNSQEGKVCPPLLEVDQGFNDIENLELEEDLGLAT